MLKNITQLKAIIDGKEGVFQCENDTTLNVVKEMLFQFQKYVGQIEDQMKIQMESAKAQEEKKVE